MGSRKHIGRAGPRHGAFLVLLVVLAAAPTAHAATVGDGAIPIPGSTPLGAAAAATPLSLDIVLRPRDPRALAAFVGAVADPASPAYRDYLRPAEFADRFGPSPQTVTGVETALRRRGLTVDGVSSDRLVIHASTSAAAAERGLHVSLDRVRGPSGAIGLLNAAPPDLPNSVAPAVTAILGLDTQAVAKEHATTTPAAGTPAAAAAASASAQGAPTPCAAAVLASASQPSYTADQLAVAYDLGPLYAAGDRGAGVTVALFELATVNPTDIAAYQACYGTTAAVNAVAVDGGPKVTDPGRVEVELDIEGVVGVAPGVAVNAYEAPNTSKGTVDAYQRIATDDTAQVVSTSWGNCDPVIAPSTISAEATIFAEMAAQGQSVFAAAGDDGSEDCSGNLGGSTALSTDDPASQPNVTGVGGTRLTATGSPPDIAPAESVWNNGGGAGGGGLSSNWAMPPYQASGATAGVINGYTTGQPCRAPTGYCRQVPDVTGSADPNIGYVVYYTGTETGRTGWQAIGGTSATAAFWAALTALVDASSACAGTPAGFLNPALYRLAAGGSRDFNDIVRGNNDAVGTHAGAYPATTGYDLASGLGSPIGATLAHDLCTPPPTAIFTFLPAAPTVGALVRFDGTASTDPNPGGTVAGYAWGFGDGTAAAGATPSHAYASAGTYTVTLRVTGSDGQTASASHQLTVAGQPLAAFAAAQAPTSLAVSFTDQSTPAAGGAPLTAWAWTFGDGTGSAAQSPTHAYTAPGTYSVGLTVTGGNGLTSSTSRQITVTALPAPAFTHQQSPLSLAVAFADASTPAPGATITAWTWSFGDGATAAGRSPSHTYAAAGSYTVRLTVTESGGPSASTEAPIAVTALLVPLAPQPTPKAAARGVSISHVRISANGVVALQATVPGKGRLVLLETVRHPRTTPSIKRLAPGPGHSVFGRRTVSRVSAGTTRITVSPLAGSARIRLVHRGHAVALDLLVSFTPAAGTPGSHATAALSLPRR